MATVGRRPGPRRAQFHGHRPADPVLPPCPAARRGRSRRARLRLDAHDAVLHHRDDARPAPVAADAGARAGFTTIVRLR
ncbi:hypothetical protein PLANTIT3_61417 [Plantibacter sp. T3]|nr:hypothetical protein PLANTIT3_61417 [Plantibacter sp. T3]